MVKFKRKKEEDNNMENKWHAVWMLEKVQNGKLWIFSLQGINRCTGSGRRLIEGAYTEVLRIKGLNSRQRTINTQSIHKALKVHITQCLWAQKVLLGGEIKRLETEDFQTLEDRIPKEEITREHTIGHNHNQSHEIG